jgi:probable phosphoglycerate mutase
MTTVFAVRHGETAWNRQGRIQGWAPVPLTDRGRTQADRLGRTLAEAYDIDRVVSSDLHRTEETVDVLLEHVDAPVTYDPGWRERDGGVFQGLEYGEVFERFPEHDVGEAGSKAAHRRPESGESLVDARDRVLGAWESTLADSGPDETVLVVTHGGPIQVVLGHAKDLDIVDTVLEQSQGNCSITEFAVDDETGELRVVRENHTGHC